MTKNNYTTKHEKNKHLTIKERAQIEILLAQGMKRTQIAKEIGIARSTLYEELKRGTVEQKKSNLEVYTKYFADAGQYVYEKHRKNSKKPHKLGQAIDFIRHTEKEILENKLSPDVICGYAKRMKSFENMVCTKTIYNYIDKGLLKVKNIDLPLRVKLKTKQRKNRKNRRILGESIENRPNNINDRSEFGHWEIDTVVGLRDSSEVLLTLDERVTRQLITVKINFRSAKAVNEAVANIIKGYGEKCAKLFKSITADNGSEFSDLSSVLSTLSMSTKVYFAHPYSSYERGTNEKQNSLIRRFFPKGKSFEKVSESAICMVQNWINNLPRKIFNYYSSNDLFSECLAKL